MDAQDNGVAKPNMENMQFPVLVGLFHPHWQRLKSIGFVKCDQPWGLYSWKNPCLLRIMKANLPWLSAWNHIFNFYIKQITNFMEIKVTIVK